MNLTQRQNEIEKEFSLLQSWEERYKKIIHLGRHHNSVEEEERTEENKVSGCQSQVWMIANLSQDGRLFFRADSDALIVRGLISLLLRIYSSSKPSEILESEPHFIKKLGFDRNLTLSRANGLYALVKKIKYYAFAFQKMIEMRS